MRFPEREALKRMGRAALEKILDYLLGKQVAGYHASMHVRLGWAEIMEYELEIRKLACKRVNQGKDNMADALLYAIRDNELRTRCFVTPLAVSGQRGRSRTPRRNVATREQEGHEGKGKGKGGHKGKGKGKTKGGSKASTGDKDNDDRGWNRVVNNIRQTEKLLFSLKKGTKWTPKCIRYNKGLCRQTACTYEHVCLRCGGAHPVPECSEPPVLK